MDSAQYWVDKLGLIPHPEGGYYKETYRSDVEIEVIQDINKRNISTGIYYLLDQNDYSSFHRIKSDEMWHFYAGDGLDIPVIHPNGVLETLRLGLDLDKGQLPQQVVPAGSWFAAENSNKSSFSLVGCTVAPGFDFNDFEMADPDSLLADYPQHNEFINRLSLKS